MLQNQLVEVAERLASALLLLAPCYDTPDMILVNTRIRRNHSQPGLIRQSFCPSVRPSVRPYMHADQVFSRKWQRPNRFGQLFFKNMNRESEILRKKYTSESNTVNNMKLIIFAKIRVITRTECIIIRPTYHVLFVLVDTVRLTSIYYRVTINQKLLVAPSAGETFVRLVKKKRSLNRGIV